MSTHDNDEAVPLVHGRIMSEVPPLRLRPATPDEIAAAHQMLARPDAAADIRRRWLDRSPHLAAVNHRAGVRR